MQINLMMPKEPDKKKIQLKKLMLDPKSQLKPLRPEKSKMQLKKLMLTPKCHPMVKMLNRSK